MPDNAPSPRAVLVPSLNSRGMGAMCEVWGVPWCLWKGKPGDDLAPAGRQIRFRHPLHRVSVLGMGDREAQARC